MDGLFPHDPCDRTKPHFDKQTRRQNKASRRVAMRRDMRKRGLVPLNHTDGEVINGDCVILSTNDMEKVFTAYQEKQEQNRVDLKWVIEDPEFDGRLPENYDFSRITNDRKFKAVVEGIQQALQLFWNNRTPPIHILGGRCKHTEVAGMRRALYILANSASLPN